MLLKQINFQHHLIVFMPKKTDAQAFDTQIIIMRIRYSLFRFNEIIKKRNTK